MDGWQKLMHLTLVVLALLMAVTSVAAAAPTTVTVVLRSMAGRPGGMDTTDTWLQYMAKEFEAQNPDIRVEVRTVVNDKYEEKMTAEFLGGTAPDILEMYGAVPMNWAEAGMLLDLAPYVAKDMSKSDIGDFFPGQWTVGKIPEGPNAGFHFGIPRYTNTDILYWNKDQFQQMGLESPLGLASRGQWTWDALLSAAKKLTKRDGEQVTIWGYRYRTMGGHWARWVHSNGGRVFAWPEKPYEFVMDTDPKAIEAIEYLHALTFQHSVSPIDRWSPRFTAGAIAIEDAWGTASIPGQLVEIGDKFAWDVAPIPVGPAGQAVGWIANDLWGINKATKNPDAAWRVLKFLTSRQAMESAAVNLGLMPARLSAMRTYMELYPKLSIMQAMEPASRALHLVYSLLPNSQAVSNLLEAAIDKVLWGKTDAVSAQQAIVGVAGAVRSALQGK